MFVSLEENRIWEDAATVPPVHRPMAAGERFPVSAEEIQDLRHALKASRERFRRNAQRSTKRIAALCQELSGLTTLCSSYRQQLAQFESGVAVVELGCKLMQVRVEKDAATHRAWTLERTLEAAHTEYARLAQERDALAQELALRKQQQLATRHS